MKPRLFQPIASQLVRSVFKWVILCIFGFSSLQAWLNYSAIERNFNMTIQDVAHTHLPLLALAIWDIEPETIRKQMALLVQNPHIAHVQIRASTGQQFAAGTVIPETSSERLLFSIPSPAGDGRQVGTMELVINRAELRGELIRSFLIVLIEVVLLAIFILVALISILRRELEKPMRQLADFVKNLQANRLSTRLELTMPPGHRYNEIDLVVDGFRIMQDSIQKHIDNQDAVVADRTRRLERAMAKLRQLSMTDGLTGCYNRMMLNERMPGEMQRAVRYERALALIFCDIDFFKSVNDLYGHTAGDQVLVAFAECLQSELRADVDWLVRYGGEEFIVVLPETSLTAAIEAAERMRLQVEQHLKIQIADGRVLNITASFGVAEKAQNDTPEMLIQRADEWLYFAKHHGRNQVQPAADHSAATIIAS
ncbi:sensor domain-containing diguanylate cyclase [Undibacterium oligocarboniphilum]|uniref:diguanylate cyclase n=1 Tax=Undibacterium oligocarboniphilum TaxID=666702 RepID=A0A850QCJ3_9BURK|nr:sensor domain-containing diguanylate cyclase [Undibacterium oligocarboniphilum]MBC3869688.1 diguanylate cyclase [Undibacterium oligocarboniphilum]NVO77291.1 diguanylate cyclase [Undibacterium oligocarboniphilum]